MVKIISAERRAESQLKIGNTLGYGAPSVQLAPMEGVLDWILRDLLSEVGGFDRMVTEFVRVTERLLPAHVFHKYCPELKNGGRTRSGTPVFVQLLGGQAGPVAENAALAAELGAPGIDLNFGCPAKTVNRHDGGASLLKNPRRLFDVTSAVRRAVPQHIPVTAKVRLGFDHKDFHKEIAHAVEDAGAAHIVVHARTKTEMYTKPAHWQYIASMREGRTIPFLANGEIWSVDDYKACVSACGVSQVALGRGVVRRPTLALEIQEVQAAANSTRASAGEFNRVDFMRRFFEMSRADRGEAFAVARLKQLLRYWSVDDTEGMDWFTYAKVLKTGSEVANFFLYSQTHSREINHRRLTI
jgi:tRNA-dihydrouridine synthase C